MEDVIAILGQVISLFRDEILPHYPFIVVVAILTIVGQFMGNSVFTRDRAYQPRSGVWYRFWENQWFWWWGRETLSLHALVTCFFITLLWSDPEGRGWTFPQDLSYFELAGIVSLFAWSLLRSFLKQKGIQLDLPGGISSVTPPPFEAAPGDVIKESDNS